MTEKLDKLWELLKAISVPIAGVTIPVVGLLSGFVWNFYGDVSNLKATFNYLNTSVAKLETGLKGSDNKLNSVVQTLISQNSDIAKLRERTNNLQQKVDRSDIAKLRERTDNLQQRVDRILEVLIKDLSLVPPLRHKSTIDGFRDEVE